jgi:hypothetical protein
MSERRYILKQPITAHKDENTDGIYLSRVGRDRAFTLIDGETFEELFVEFDRETLKQQIADDLLKLIESHNELLLYTASSCADSFREYEAREVIDWADGKNEQGNSINTDLAKAILDVAVALLDPKGEQDG